MVESSVFIRKLCFYPGVLNTGKLIQYSWPPGGAHDPACSVHLLPPSLWEFLRRGNFKSEQSGGSHPLAAVSAGFWHRMHKIKLHLEKVKRAKPEGRWNKVLGSERMCLSIILWMVLFILRFQNILPLGKKIRQDGIKTSGQPEEGSVPMVQCF